MPEVNKQKVNTQKKRLGRGLGSLLTTQMEDFAPDEIKNLPKAPLPQAKAEEKPVEKRAEAPATRPPEPKKAEPVQEIKKEIKELDDENRIWSLAIDKINPNKTQPRKDFDKAPLEELAASIKEQGLLQPITVRKKDDAYEIIAGERRWRASQLAGLHEVPVIIRNVDDQKSMELALIENLQRENLNPVEESLAYQLLIEDYDLNHQEVATKVGKDRTSVTNALRLLTLPKDILGFVRRGEIMVGHAKVLLSVEDPKTQTSLAKKTVAKKLSVRALEKEIKASRKKSASELNELDVSERLADGLASDLQKTLGTKVNIVYKSGKGRIEIAFYSDDELSDFCEKIKDTWQKNR